MKRIINGKRYDTETAECLVGWDNGLCKGDHNWYKEVVYRKKTGEFFKVCGGGPNAMRIPCGSNSYCGGETLEPLTDEEAQSVLEKCGEEGVEVLEKYFEIEE